MAFALSPSVTITETDLTLLVPAIATSIGAFAGVFRWGPILDPITISSENVLVQQFQKPDDTSTVFSSFFTAANYLSYSNNLLLVRVDGTNYKNASDGGNVTSLTLTGNGSGYSAAPAVTIAAGTGKTARAHTTVSAGTGATFNATAGGGTYSAVAVNAAGTGYAVGDKIAVLGTNLGGVTPTNDLNIVVSTINGSGGIVTFTFTGTSTGSASFTNQPLTLRVQSIVLDYNGSGYTGAPAVTIAAPTAGGTATATSAVNTASTIDKIKNSEDYQNNFNLGQGTAGTFSAKFPGRTFGNALAVAFADSATYTGWNFASSFTAAPGTSTDVANRGGSNDELHIVVIDETGDWTGVPGQILETYAFVSKALDAKKADGTSNYYKNVIASQSAYLWVRGFPSGTANWGTSGTNTTFDSLSTHYWQGLFGGVSDFAPTDGNIENGYDLFNNADKFDISLIMTGGLQDRTSPSAVANYITQNIAEVRKDCITFVSPVDPNSKAILVGSTSSIATAMVGFRNQLTSSSYMVLDSGYKYMYDRYNDKFRYVPLNGDIAGLCARTDLTNDPWWSPGGFQRGQIKNVVKLAYNPNRTDRDTLFSNSINPVVTFPGQGTVLFGDKTCLAKPSAFDHINVRRLFIVLEKSIATAAKFELFEFNDAFTQAQFKSLVEPFLRDVQGRRGIIDFRVKCDSTNNTPQVVDANQFVADIFIKPARSINYIFLNFIAARSGVDFTEIGA